jgi:hypothetical protein
MVVVRGACLLGYYLKDKKCIRCPGGWTSSEDSLRCLPCVAGGYSKPGSDKCSNCQERYGSNPILIWIHRGAPNGSGIYYLTKKIQEKLNTEYDKDNEGLTLEVGSPPKYKLTFDGLTEKNGKVPTVKCTSQGKNKNCPADYGNKGVDIKMWKTAGGASKCDICQAGTFGPSYGIGFSNLPGDVIKRTSQCIPCRNGFFTNSPGQISCSPHTTCPKGTWVAKLGTRLSDIVCSTTRGTCPGDKWESRPSTSTQSIICEDSGTCPNGTLIPKEKRRQKNHCVSCNVGYRLCRDREDCERSTKGDFVVDPTQWKPGRDCVPYKCECKNGTLDPKRTCLSDGYSLCMGCDKAHYRADTITLRNVNNQDIMKDEIVTQGVTEGKVHSVGDDLVIIKRKGSFTKKGILKIKTLDKEITYDNLIETSHCIPWTLCNEKYWVKKPGSLEENRICEKCPVKTVNTREKDDKGNTQEKITDCKCSSGESTEVRDNKNNIIDIKCSCTNGSIQQVKGSREKDCICNYGYYGGGKLTTTKYYPPCKEKIDCKCSNGSIATNVPCELRDIKNITQNRTTNTSEYGECSYVNSLGERWSPTIGPLSDPRNKGFKLSKIKCRKKDELLCESCMDGFQRNKVPIKLSNGKLIPVGVTCISPSEMDLLTKPREQRPTTIDKMKQTSTGEVSKNPYKLTVTQGQSATARRYNRMVRLNRP